MTMTKAMKHLVATVTASSARGDEPEITITTIDPDRMGDRVVLEGLDLKNFMKNPALFFGPTMSAGSRSAARRISASSLGAACALAGGGSRTTGSPRA